MKKSLPTLIIGLISIFLTNQSFAQRYLTEVFSSVNVTYGKAYGQNYNFITGSPVLDSLRMDIYQPEGDAEVSRPVVLYFHTGSFLPILVNHTPTGDMRDSATVEMCKDFARRGYVAISMDYRTGWNPASSEVDIRTGTLLQAVYRALQDAKSCVRYLKMTAQNQSNPWHIDTNRIILGGQGSGGYIALAYATLDDPNEIALLKFIATGNFPDYGIFQGAPFVIGDIWGDLDGFGGDPTLNHDNWPGYTSNVQFLFNMGGAMGDSSWLEAGDVPMCSFHSINDPFAPYGLGTVDVPCDIMCSCPVIVPTTGQFVVNVAGSLCLMDKVDEVFNNNQSMKAYTDIATDPYTVRANQINDGHEGLFPFVLSDPSIVFPGEPFHGQAGPWEWWDTTALKIVAPFYDVTPALAVIYAQSGLFTNPDMSKTKALAYIDTMQEYLAPRIVQSLQLPGYIGIDEVHMFDRVAKMFPNPATDVVTLELDDPSQKIQNLTIVDVAGRVVREMNNVNSYRVKINRGDLSQGLYFIKCQLEDKQINGKLIFQ